MSNNLKTAMLLAGLGALCMFIGSFWGRTGLFIGLLIGLAMCGGSYWFSSKLAIRSAHAVEVSAEQMPQYHAIMRDLCQRAGLPMPRLYVAPNPQPNAFATGPQPVRRRGVRHRGPVAHAHLGRDPGRARPRARRTCATATS